MDCARSSAVAPISIAKAASPMSSPAPEPQRPTPRIRAVVGSMINFVTPSGRSKVSARPEAPPIELHHLDGNIVFFGFGFREARPSDLRVRKNDRRNDDIFEFGG